MRPRYPLHLLTRDAEFRCPHHQRLFHGWFRTVPALRTRCPASDPYCTDLLRDRIDFVSAPRSTDRWEAARIRVAAASEDREARLHRFSDSPSRHMRSQMRVLKRRAFRLAIHCHHRRRATVRHPGRARLSGKAWWPFRIHSPPRLERACSKKVATRSTQPQPSNLS